MEILSSAKVLCEDGQRNMANLADGILQLFTANAPNSLDENI